MRWSASWRSWVAARQVQARIDSHAKVLYARLADPRSATFANALRISAHHNLIAHSCAP